VGYDMYWHEPPEDEQKALKTLEDELFGAQSNSLIPRSKFDEYFSRRDPFYFRLNIWGMQKVREELMEAGVVDPDAWYSDDWPEPPNDEYEEKPGESPEWQLYWKEHAEFVARHPGDQPGIPAYKFGSNDGWHVTSGEILATFSWLDAKNAGWRSRLSELSLSFVAWMTAAATEGKGFDVY
jgi:hypothetical protein